MGAPDKTTSLDRPFTHFRKQRRQLEADKVQWLVWIRHLNRLPQFLVFTHRSRLWGNLLTVGADIFCQAQLSVWFTRRERKMWLIAYEVSNRLSIYIALFWSVSEKTFVQILRLFFDALVNKHALRTRTKQIASPSTSATRVRSPYGLGLLLILDLREVFLRASISKFQFHLTGTNIFKWGLESSQMSPE